MSRGVVASLIGWSARNPAVVVVLTVLAAVFGAWSLQRTPLDALPDLSDTQVIVLTEWRGQNPDVVEDQVTWPVSTELLATPGVRAVRGRSSMGQSFVYVVFEDGIDLYDARQHVLERLDRVDLPAGAEPELGPDATGVGWVYQYVLLEEGSGLGLAELTTLQDFTLRPALESLDGVAEVARVGGAEKEFQVELDPRDLITHDITAGEVVRAIRAADGDSGGGTLEIAGHEHAVRGNARLRTMADLRQIPVRPSVSGGTPLLLGHLAHVTVGPAPRRGLADLDGQGEVVGGIVIMRSGDNALAVIDRVKARLAEVELPAGVRIEPVYDRSELIDEAGETLGRTLLEEAVVIGVVVLVFLGRLRSAVVVFVALPVAALLAFVPMVGQGLTANIMSLGGIAVAFGAMVDGALVVVENVHRRLAEWQQRPEGRDRTDVVVEAMQEVGPSIFFSLLVIVVSFAPVFLLEQTEGRLFRPLAFTKTYAMAFAALLAVTLTPALVMWTVRGRVSEGGSWLADRYAGVVRWSVDHRRAVVLGAAGLVVASLPLWLALDTEFMPPLHEGDLLYMPTAPPGMSETEAAKVLQISDRALASIPEVQHAFGKVGRALTATDPAPLSMIETTITVAPRSQWRDGLTWQGLVDELDAAVQIPGMPNLFWMPIQTRTEMLATGVRTPIAVQIFGADPAALQVVGTRVEEALRGVGARSVFAQRAAGGFYVDVDLDRRRAAKFGVRASDLDEALGIAVAGRVATQVIDGRARHDVTVRYPRDFRDSVDALQTVLVPTVGGDQLSLRSVADVFHRTGPPVYESEDGERVSYVFVDPGSEPIGTFAAKARAAVAHVQLEPGTRLGFTGQFEHLERLRARLLLVVPLTLGVVALLLFVNTRSWFQTALVMAAVPFSLIGAVALVWALDFHLSVAVWVGMIALAGLDAEMGVVMLLYLRLAHERWDAAGRLTGEDALREAIVEGAAHRLRPKLMTVCCSMFGLLPLLFATGAGADVMQRMAAPMVGGLASSFVLELLVYPAAFAWWKSR